MALPHPTICLHSDVFHIPIEILKLMITTSDQRDTERLLTAAT
jgi:hypothetical protein